MILHKLNEQGIFAWENRSDGVKTDSGQWIKRSGFLIRGGADILGILGDGVLLAIEVKLPNKKSNTSLYQKAFIAKINKNKGVAFVATSWEEVVAELEMRGYVIRI